MKRFGLAVVLGYALAAFLAGASGHHAPAPISHANAAPIPVLSGAKYSPSSSLTAEQDFAARAAGSVWFQDFDSDAEVDAFRWSGGYAGGNDPLENGTARNQGVKWNSTDGPTPGSLEITRELQSGCGPSSCTESNEWWRPFSPIVGSGNGKGVDDPGDGGLLPAQPYAATDGGSQISNWNNTSHPGWYGHTDYHTGTIFDGTDFYIQMRIKVDPRRTTSGNSSVGKLFYVTITNFSLSGQEVVTYSGLFPVSGVGQPNYHSIYTSGSPPLADQDSLGRPGIQQGSALANYGASHYCDPSTPSLRQYCWAYSNGWDTLLYHFTPGHEDVEDTRIEVWAAHEGETSYTKIWDVTYDTGFEIRNGWNSLLLAAYQNGQEDSEFWHRYDQIIFSKHFIACPQI